MVYLSEVTLDPRSRITMRLLGDTYALHRRILMAYPEKDEGGAGRVLFRVDTRKDGVPAVLVQSERRPDWSRAAEGAFSQVRGPKEWEPSFRAGQALRFRLRANPTYKKDGKRRAWTERHEQLAWLQRKGEPHGFEIVPLPSGPSWFDPFDDQPEARAEVRIVPLNHLVGHKPDQQKSIEHFGVDFDGCLRVTDSTRFAEAIASGVGPAKGFGFGLLSVAAK